MWAPRLLLWGLLSSGALLSSAANGMKQHLPICRHQQQEGDNPEERGTLQTHAPQVKRPQEVQNPAQCPRTEPGLPRPISAYCVEGSACPGDELCCRIRNIRKCVLPDGVHPGYCPREQQKQQTVAQKRCSRDADCARHEKCCQKAGHRKCIRAEPAHPGLCPKMRNPRVGVPCVDECKDDRDCAAANKCCFSRCGLKCVSREQHDQDQDQDQDQTEPSLEQEAGDEGSFVLRSVRDVCRLPRSEGSSCNATSSLHVFYNAQVGLCEKFIYRGCGGNGNNFATQLACLRSCSNPSICQLALNQGFGDAFRTRFYYNSTSKTCERFLYRGHGGNANNFWEKDYCLQFCARREECGARGGKSFQTLQKAAVFFLTLLLPLPRREGGSPSPTPPSSAPTPCLS